jgi:hypothetical protein
MSSIPDAILLEEKDPSRIVEADFHCCVEQSRKSNRHKTPSHRQLPLQMVPDQQTLPALPKRPTSRDSVPQSGPSPAPVFVSSDDVVSDSLSSPRFSPLNLRTFPLFHLRPRNRVTASPVSPQQQPMFSSQVLDLNLQHSDLALNMTFIEPNITDFEAFHRPRFDSTKFLDQKRVISFRLDLTECGDTPLSPFLKDLRSLSGSRGGVIMVEHTSETSSFILNDRPLANLEILHILDPNQTAPCIAHIPRDEPLLSINCRVCSVPVAEQFYVRRFSAIYCAGSSNPDRSSFGRQHRPLRISSWTS